MISLFGPKLTLTPLTAAPIIASMKISYDKVDFDKLKEDAEREHRLDIEAIERVRRLLGKSASSLPTDRNGAPRRAPKNKLRSAGAGKGKLLRAVRSIVKAKTGIFTRYMIEESLQKEFPEMIVKRGSLKSVLKRLADDGGIEVVVPPLGRRHAQYRRGKSAPNKEDD